MPNKITWTEDMNEALVRLRREHVPLLRCAEKIGVSYPTAVLRARELNVHKRLNVGRRTGESIYGAARR